MELKSEREEVTAAARRREEEGRVEREEHDELHEATANGMAPWAWAD